MKNKIVYHHHFQLYILLLFTSFLLVFLLAVSGCSDKQTSEHLEITAMQVKEADSLLIRQGDSAILIDTGLKGSADQILDTLKAKKISRLDYLIITHYDKDHVGSAAKILQSIKVDQILCPDYTGTRDEYIAFRQTAPNRILINQKTEYVCGNLRFTVLPASNPAPLIAEQEEYDNDLSLVTELEYGSRKFLFTGDIEKRRIEQMLVENELSHCDWIKIPHHGKYQKKLVDLLAAVRPTYAVISTSEKAAPSDKLLNLLNQEQIQFECTMNGNVTTFCDGDSIWMTVNSNK